MRQVGQPDGGDGRAPGRGGPDRSAAQDDGCEQGRQEFDRGTGSEQQAGQDGTPARASPDRPDRAQGGQRLEMRLHRRLQDGERTPGAEDGESGVAPEATQGGNQGRQRQVQAGRGRLQPTFLSAGQAGGVQRAKPQLGQRRVDSARVGAVQPGTAGLAQDGPAGDVVRPEKAVAQPGKVRVVGWVPVRVDAGGLHPAVPGVAVEIVGELRMPGDGHRAQRDAARGQHR